LLLIDFHNTSTATTHVPTLLDFETFYYYFAENIHKKALLTNSKGTPANGLMLYYKSTHGMKMLKIIATDLIQGPRNMAPSMLDIILKMQPDYYVAINEGWITKDQEAVNKVSELVKAAGGYYEHGTVTKLLSEQRIETLIISGRTKNNSAEKIKLYEIVRER
jgi:hypothetical protein